jgi:TonB family protein
MRLPICVAACCACLTAGFGQSGPGDSLDKYQKELETNPRGSLAHYRIAEIFLQQNNYQSAANELREALNGDLDPKWIEMWSHIELGKIFDLTGQRDRAVNEYRLANESPPDRSLPPVGKDAVGPEPIETSEPEYSEEARAAGIEGSVALTGVITADGVARNMRVTRSLGFGLDEKALGAIARWRFRPGTDKGQPIPMVITASIEFRLPEKQSRWHLIRAEFQPPEGASRPRFLQTKYPYGSGISVYAVDEGAVVMATGREGTARIALDVDEHGTPVNLRVLGASHEVWGREAMAVVREWQFVAGMKAGAPVAVPCTLDLVWAGTTLTPLGLHWAMAQMGTSDPAQTAPSSDSKTNSLAVLYMPQPSYTDAARQAGLEGTVVISLLVAEDGAPQDLSVVRSLGMGLDEKAVEAVSQWRFRPTLLNGRPAATRVAVEVRFALNQ